MQIAIVIKKKLIQTEIDCLTCSCRYSECRDDVVTATGWRFYVKGERDMGYKMDINRE